MKTGKFLGGVLLVTALLSVGAIQAKKPQKKSTAEKLEQVEAAQAELTLELNRLVWNSYFDYAQRRGSMVDMRKFKSINIKAVCDTVPALKSLWDAEFEAYKLWQQVLATDPEYEAIHAEYISLKGVNDKEKKNANLQRYNLLYDRLSKDNPNYNPARERKNALRKQLDEAIAYYLLSYYHARGEVMPCDEVLGYSLVRTLRQETLAIREQEQELSILAKLKAELEEQLLRERYDVKRRVTPAGAGAGYTGAANMK